MTRARIMLWPVETAAWRSLSRTCFQLVVANMRLPDRATMPTFDLVSLPSSILLSAVPISGRASMREMVATTESKNSPPRPWPRAS